MVFWLAPMQIRCSWIIVDCSNIYHIWTEMRHFFSLIWLKNMPDFKFLLFSSVGRKRATYSDIQIPEKHLMVKILILLCSVTSYFHIWLINDAEDCALPLLYYTFQNYLKVHISLLFIHGWFYYFFRSIIQCSEQQSLGR